MIIESEFDKRAKWRRWRLNLVFLGFNMFNLKFLSSFDKQIKKGY